MELTTHPLTAPRDWKTGDLCGIESPRYAGRVFRIEKINPKTILLVPADPPGGLKVKTYRSSLTDPPKPGAPAPEVVIPEHMPAGTFARYTGRQSIPRSMIHPGCVVIVLADKGERVNCCAPGGIADDYYGRILRRHLTPLDSDSVRVLPAADDPGLCACTGSAGGLSFRHLRTDHI